MEALIAVGLAGNVVQFVQFSSVVISEARAIRATGRSSSLARLKELSTTLTRHANTVKMRIEGNGTPLEPEEEVRAYTDETAFPELMQI